MAIFHLSLLSFLRLSIGTEKTYVYLFVLRGVDGQIEEAVLGLGQPAGEPVEEGGDLVDLLDVQLVLVALGGRGALHHGHVEAAAELLVPPGRVLEEDLLGLERLQLAAHATYQSILEEEELKFKGLFGFFLAGK